MHGPCSLQIAYLSPIHRYIEMKKWTEFLVDAEIVDGYVNFREARLCFAWSHACYYDEILEETWNETRNFSEFLESICRLVDITSGENVVN